MAGRRLLDLASLFNASRGVARKHVALQSQQLELWSQTSSIARILKGQTDRVAETAKAASFLASRLNGNAPAWALDSSQAGKDGSIPSRKGTEGKDSQSAQKHGLEQDHFYERSVSNATPDTVPTEDLSVLQKKSDRYPLPDGTIPSAQSSLNMSKRDQDVFSKRPQAPSKDRLHEGHDKEDALSPASSKDSTIPVPSDKLIPLSSDHARKLQRQYEQQIPSQSADAEAGHSDSKLSKGHDDDIFYAPLRHISPVLSSLSRAKIPKQTESTQGDDEHLRYQGINSDSYSSASLAASAVPTAQAVPEQEQVPEGINTDLFYSPRVARMLGGSAKHQPEKELHIRAPSKMPPKHIRGPSCIDQDTFPTPTSAQDEPVSIIKEYDEAAKIAEEIKKDFSPSPDVTSGTNSLPATYEMRESKVPASRIGRLWNYGGLAAGMFGGAVSESLRRATGSGGEGSYMLSAGNMHRLVAKLSRMRGAALKLGQMMSFQDSKMLPAPIQQVLLRVQDSADYMPASQRDKVLSSNLGPAWRDLFSTFEEKPMAAASIGQVHSATLRSTGQHVAVKVQYPGVASSIDSDLSNLAILLTASRLLPKGLYLDKTIANARTELAWECDYIREAECGQLFQGLLSDEKDTFVVPRIFPEASGKQVLTMEYMEGAGVTKVQNFTQEQKDWIGTQILRLCLREITEFKFMQTDPNWTNFLFNAATNKLELLDFGASRAYPEEFIGRYTRLLLAASKLEKDTVRNLSIELGYLTGYESKTMLDAHIESVMTLAEPFLVSSPKVYDFREQTITERVKELIPVMVRERLAPPPEETYSLHRKLSGAFLLCARLGSRVSCRELFENSMRKAGL